MSKKHILCMFLLLSLLICSLVSCDLPTVSVGSSTPTVSSPTNTPGDQGKNSAQLNTWYPGSRGVEVRYEDWKSPGNNEDTVTLAHFHLLHLKYRLTHNPHQPILIPNSTHK